MINNGSIENNCHALSFDNGNEMIYNVYHIERQNTIMEIILSKWGNSLGFRIPSGIVKTMKLKEGDKLIINQENNKSFKIAKKESNSVENILCNFYGKDIEQIMSMNIVDTQNEIDWGDDVGAEIIK